MWFNVVHASRSMWFNVVQCGSCFAFNVVQCCLYLWNAILNYIELLLNHSQLFLLPLPAGAEFSTIERHASSVSACTSVDFGRR